MYDGADDNGMMTTALCGLGSKKDSLPNGGQRAASLSSSADDHPNHFKWQMAI